MKKELKASFIVGAIRVDADPRTWPDIARFSDEVTFKHAANGVTSFAVSVRNNDHEDPIAYQGDWLVKYANGHVAVFSHSDIFGYSDD